MAATAWIALGGVLLTAVLNAAGYLIAWGVMKQTVKSLDGRVTALEAEIKAIDQLRNDVIRIGERQDMWIEQLKELNSSIRWMRDPAPIEPPPLPSVARPRVRK